MTLIPVATEEKKQATAEALFKGLQEKLQGSPSAQEVLNFIWSTMGGSLLGEKAMEIFQMAMKLGEEQN